MESKIEIGLIIGWGSMFTLVLIIIIISQFYRTKILRIEKEKQMASFKAVVDAEERLKEAIANNLHDEVIPMLTALRQNSKQHSKEFNGGVRTVDVFEKDSELIDQSIKAIRAVALDLIPTTFLNFGLIKALEQYAVQLNTNDRVVEFESKIPLAEEIPFPKNEQINLYRMCLEILNNLGKHSGYTALSIRFLKNETSYEFRFVHDGSVINNEEIETLTRASTGLGLRSLASRASLLNAGINYSKEGNVPVIHLQIPISK